MSASRGCGPGALGPAFALVVKSAGYSGSKLAVPHVLGAAGASPVLL